MIVSSRLYYPRLGRISCGFQASRQSPRGVVTYPSRSDTLVFSSDDRARIEAVASVLGGTVQQSPRPAGADERWFVVTGARELEVLLPSLDDQTWDAWYEAWGQGGLVRRCDGSRCLIAVDPETGERREDVPCVCDAEGLEGDARCRVTARLNVVVPRLSGVVPGIGVWQVVSRGESTYRAIASVVELLRTIVQATGAAAVRIPLVLRVEERQGRDSQGRPRRWPVLTLQSTAPMAAIVGLGGASPPSAVAAPAAAAVAAPEPAGEELEEAPF